MVRHLLFAASVLVVLNLWPGPIVAQVMAAAPIAPGPFGSDDADAQPTVDLSADTGASSAVSDPGASGDPIGSSAVPASNDAGPAANPPDPSAEIAPAISVLDASGTPEVADTSSPSAAPESAAGISLPPVPGLEPGPLPLTVAGGPQVAGPGLPGPQIGVPTGPGSISVPLAANSNPSAATAVVQPNIGPTQTQGQAQASIPQWLKKVLSPAVFLSWLFELLPMLLRALLAGLAALLSTMVLPPGGVVWRLPPELSYQLGGIGQAHAVLVQIADAALAVIVALVGFGHIAGPHAGLPVLPPRAMAPRMAVAVLMIHGSLAMGAWVIDLHNALLAAMTPSDLVGFDPGTWLQSGPGGLVLGVLYALAGLLLALGGWLRLALVDVLLVGAPVLAVLWVLPITAEWGEWALRLFGNVLAGQWLQVLALWLGGQMLLAPASDLGGTLGKGFAALALLYCALWLPGLLPGPRGVGGLQVLLGFAVARQVLQGVRGQRDRLERDFARRKELEQRYAAEHPRPPLRVQVVSSRRQRGDGSAS